MKVILIFIAILVFQSSAFTVNDNIKCSLNTNRFKKTAGYSSQITPFNDDVYEIGTNTVWGTKNGETALYEVILFRNGDSYKAHGIGPDLSIFNQTYISPTRTQLLEVIQHLVFVKEYSSDSSSYKFAVYYFDTDNVASTSLKRITIDPLVYSTGDIRYGLNFNKLLQYNEVTKTLYFVLTNAAITEVYLKKLDNSGPFESHFKIGDQRVNITVGNYLLMFDDSIRSYYKFKNDGSNYDILPIKTTSSGNQFGSVLTNNFAYYKMLNGNFAITSHQGAIGAVSSTFGFFNEKDLIASGEDLTGNGQFMPIVHYNKYNFIFISQNIFSFCRYNTKLIFTYQDLSILTSSERTEAKTDFQSAMRVAFNIEKQFILTLDSIKIYQLSYKNNGANINRINKLASISLTNDVTASLQNDTNQWIKLKVKCSCAKVLVTKMKCFSSRFKCLGINSYIPDDCTINYNDDVAEFV